MGLSLSFADRPRYLGQPASIGTSTLSFRAAYPHLRFLGKMKPGILFMTASLALFGCAKRAEWRVTTLTDTIEIVSPTVDKHELRRLVAIEIECPQRAPGPLQISIEIKNQDGMTLTDIIPAYHFIELDKKRIIYISIKYDDLQKHPTCTLYAHVKSEGFTPIVVDHQFEYEGAKP